MRLDYNSTVHKTLLYPVWERESSTSQDILVSWPLYPNIRGYIVNVFFSLLGRAATPKKKSLIKSTTCFMSWEQCYQGYNSRKYAHIKKIGLVIKMSKQFLSKYAGKLSGSMSF